MKEMKLKVLGTKPCRENRNKDRSSSYTQIYRTKILQTGHAIVMLNFPVFDFAMF